MMFFFLEDLLFLVDAFNSVKEKIELGTIAPQFNLQRCLTDEKVQYHVHCKSECVHPVVV